MILCGITIPCDVGLDGHSDADVGIHALCDAIYGALAEGDIGRHFPPTDADWKDADSARFLRHAAGRIAARGGQLANVDVTLICERPKITPHAPAMRARLAELLGVSRERCFGEGDYDGAAWVYRAAGGYRGAGCGVCAGAGGLRKAFFFEKKKQKTFWGAVAGSRTGVGHQRDAWGLRAGGGTSGGDLPASAGAGAGLSAAAAQAAILGPARAGTRALGLDRRQLQLDASRLGAPATPESRNLRPHLAGRKLVRKRHSLLLGTRKISLLTARPLPQASRQRNKSFLLLFFQKRRPSFLRPAT